MFFARTKTHPKDMTGAHTTVVLTTAVWCVFVACAHGEVVATADELIRLFKDTTSTVSGRITLSDDLDFSASSINLPLGASDDNTCVTFSGTFDGNGHSIKNLRMNNTRTVQMCGPFLQVGERYCEKPCH